MNTSKPRPSSGHFSLSLLAPWVALVVEAWAVELLVEDSRFPADLRGGFCPTLELGTLAFLLICASGSEWNVGRLGSCPAH